jgi:hypothetical protein
LLRTGSFAHDRFEFFPLLFTDFERCGSESSHGSRCVAEFSPAFLPVKTTYRACYSILLRNGFRILAAVY